MVAFTVLGRPQPAGSKRAFQHPKTKRILIVDASKNAKPWKREVARVAAEHIDELLDGPLAVDITFVLSRPKSHYGTGRNAETLKDSAPAYPTSPPDVDKLSRAILDACTTAVWHDDSQVVEKVARKVYGTPERCEVAVSSKLTFTSDGKHPV